MTTAIEVIIIIINPLQYFLLTSNIQTLYKVHISQNNLI
jgi:hypothetical protein